MKRTSRTVRKKQMVVLTKRDIKILYTVGRFSLAATHHLANLYFNGVTNTANKRLRSLFNADFLNAHAVLGNNHDTLYTLTSKGRRILRKRLGIGNGLVSIPRTLDVADLEHRLAIIDVRVALVLASQSNSNLRLHRFLTGNEITAHTRSAGISVIPDAIILVERKNKKIAFALEMDMGTESLSIWRKKTQNYTEAFAMDLPLLCGQNWNVLVAAPSQTRLKSIAHTIQKFHSSNRFLFAEISKITPETFLGDSFFITPKGVPFLTGKDNE